MQGDHGDRKMWKDVFSFFSAPFESLYLNRMREERKEESLYRCYYIKLALPCLSLFSLYRLILRVRESTSNAERKGKESRKQQRRKPKKRVQFFPLYFACILFSVNDMWVILPLYYKSTIISPSWTYKTVGPPASLIIDYHFAVFGSYVV